ncbi:MAG: hypothetical protein ACK52W_07930 [Alphaproteobacteria bacterium]
MGIFSWLLGDNSQPQPAVAMTQMAMPPATAAAPVDPASVANDNAAPTNLVELANDVLKRAFTKTHVKNLATGKDVPMPVAAVELTVYAPDKNGPILAGSSAADSSTLKIRLKEPTGGFDFHSVNLALRQVLNHIPLLKGKLGFEPEKQPTYGEAWQIIAPVLQKHGVDEHTVESLKKHFSVHPERSMDQWNWDKIKVTHDAGKVQVKIMPEPNRAEDAKKIASTDQQIVDFVNTHKTQILEHIKAKVLALSPLPEGVTAESLAGLDCKVTMEAKDRWEQGIKVEFGDGPELKETALAKINTELLDKFFTEALVHVGGKLPEFFSDVADGVMVADIIREKTKNDPALKNILTADHFLSEEMKAKRAEILEKAGARMVNAAQELGGEHSNDIIMTLPLPKGVTLPQLRADIVNAQHQLTTTPSGQGHGRAV